MMQLQLLVGLPYFSAISTTMRAAPAYPVSIWVQISVNSNSIN